MWCFCFQPPTASTYDVAYPNTSEKVDVQDVEAAVSSPSEPSEEFKVNVTNFGLVPTNLVLLNSPPPKSCFKIPGSSLKPSS